ncbi:hypothetical protein NDU88_003560 [Pleurodeles waltl]|uniref:Uncharacterized protein n=1 Tax=Pleurodeles waltl TaxID=8319 RepID=A0AAV7P9X6_PLEWA|nr:hypothetical protein NDU88_003560 [Pleurodeles waltl]
MTPLAPSFQLPFSLSPPVGGDPSETQTQHAFRFKFPPAGGSWWPGPPPRPQRSTASRPGGQGGPPVLRVTLAPRAPVRCRSPRALLHDRRGGPAGAPAAGIHLRGAPQLSPGLSPPNLNSPQQGDLGGQGLRHGPSAAPQAAQAVREGSRSSGSHSRLARRCGAAHPRPPPRQEGGVRRRPRGRDPLSGHAPSSHRASRRLSARGSQLRRAPKPTSDPPGASRSGRHLELLFTGAAGSPYEGEPPAFHRFAPTNFSTGPRDTGAPCTAFFRSLGP